MSSATQTGSSRIGTGLAEEISGWLRERFEEGGAEKFVLGLSGGIDSALVCGLAARAVGNERVVGVIMPSASNPDDAISAAKVAETFDVTTLTVDLSDLTNDFKNALSDATSVRETLIADASSDDNREQLADANIKPRLRMTTVYYVANLCRGIVLGTGNKSEAMIGYYTKYGDGGVDLLPIIDLYKHEVRELARAIGVPDSVIARPPSAGLWEGQTDEDEIGMSYEELDAVLAAIERGDTSGLVESVVEHVKGMMSGSQHKRSPIPAFRRN